ncbi:hypothetical protein GGS20DRAFT_174309 [Poronia punctata]|nr:hypothetical protein GGS20DRAFT_174309 [Poronia punctata]
MRITLITILSFGSLIWICFSFENQVGILGPVGDGRNISCGHWLSRTTLNGVFITCVAETVMALSIAVIYVFV